MMDLVLIFSGASFGLSLLAIICGFNWEKAKRPNRCEVIKFPGRGRVVDFHV
jgi:hypothetical protein